MFQAQADSQELLPGIKKVRYSHDALVDAIIANPAVRQRDLAALFGYTEGWISQVISSDSFQARLRARKGELVDPEIVASVENQMQGVARQALEVISEKLTASKSPDLALRALDISSRALGYGVRKEAGVTLQQQFVVALPPKSQDPASWIAEYSPAGQGTASTPGTPKPVQLPRPDMDLVIPPQVQVDSQALPRATLAEFESMIEMAAVAVTGARPVSGQGGDESEE